MNFCYSFIMGGKYKILVLDLVSETRSQRVVSPQCSGAPATGQRAGDSLRVSGAGAPVGSEAGSSPRSGRDLVSGVAPPPLPVQVPPSVPLARISAPRQAVGGTPHLWLPPWGTCRRPLRHWICTAIKKAFRTSASRSLGSPGPPGLLVCWLLSLPAVGENQNTRMYVGETGEEVRRCVGLQDPVLVRLGFCDKMP